MTEYKVLLHLWHKGTGGGPGLDIYLESWSEEIKLKYSIDTETYDHSNVAKRPALLIEDYSHDTVKKLYLTVIHMWDELSSHLLSSKHDPFANKKGEIGLPLSSDGELESDKNTSSEPHSSSSVSRNRANTNAASTPLSSVKTIKRRKKQRRNGQQSPTYADDNDIRGAIKAIIANNNHTKDKEVEPTKPSPPTQIEDLSLNELFEQMDQRHLQYY